MQAAVFVSIIEVSPHTVTDHKSQLFIDGDVACIKHTMNVSSKQQAVRHFMIASASVGSDMCCVKRW